MHCEECGNVVYQAGETVPAGVYMRIDDGSLRRVALTRRGPLPASFDGHIATYRGAASACACERRHARRCTCRRAASTTAAAEHSGGSLSTP
jgi:hypothetical protein